VKEGGEIWGNLSKTGERGEERSNQTEDASDISLHVQKQAADIVSSRKKGCGKPSSKIWEGNSRENKSIGSSSAKKLLKGGQSIEGQCGKEVLGVHTKPNYSSCKTRSHSLPRTQP